MKFRARWRQSKETQDPQGEQYSRCSCTTVGTYATLGGEQWAVTSKETHYTFIIFIPFAIVHYIMMQDTFIYNIF